jgi:hypothetical protein
MSFTRLEATDFVVSSDSVTAPAWSTNNPTLTNFFISSSHIPDLEKISPFYIDVYQSDPNSNASASVQFSLAYGNFDGNGSKPFNPLVPEMTPSVVTYRQYRNLVYGDPTKKFKFGNVETDDIFVIAVDRNRYKGSLFPGTFNLTINNRQFTDNSNDSTTVTYLDCGRAFDVVSGSYGKAVDSEKHGLFLPDVGLIILSSSIAIGTTPEANKSSNLENEKDFFTAISASGYFQLNSQETVSSNYVFARVKNGEYNYTSNPSFVSGSGDLVYSNFINNPQTFPTTVGLYNDNNELIAVAKMSRPLPKDFTKECLIRIKLDW